MGNLETEAGFNLNLSELSPQGDVAADALLEMIGDVAKLAVILSELSEEEIKALSPRIGAFLSAVKALPVQEVRGWKTVGEA